MCVSLCLSCVAEVPSSWACLRPVSNLHARKELHLRPHCSHDRRPPPPPTVRGKITFSETGPGAKRAGNPCRSGTLCFVNLSGCLFLMSGKFSSVTSSNIFSDSFSSRGPCHLNGGSFNVVLRASEAVLFRTASL